MSFFSCGIILLMLVNRDFALEEYEKRDGRKFVSSIISFLPVSVISNGAVYNSLEYSSEK